MKLYAAPLAPTVAALSGGALDLRTYLEETCARLDELEPQLCAFLPESERRTRLRAEARALLARYPADAIERPALFGVPVGIKDLFRVAGFETRAGSCLPPEVFAGAEASIVTRLRQAGALVLGKTTTEEFAYRGTPPPTRNPHNLAHTPGGSSSGSAAAVAAGLCPLALGTQTLRSTIGPAAYCGTVGFKLSHARVPLDGLVLLSAAIDSLGLFTQDAAGAELAAAALVHDWQPAQPTHRPVLAKPTGPFMEFLSDEAQAMFARQCARLRETGYEVVELPVPWDAQPEDVYQRMIDLLRAEMARYHRDWFARYANRYGPDTTKAIHLGRAIPDARLAALRADRLELRALIHQLMDETGVDLWITPSSWGSAPVGFTVTGSAGMTGAWSYVGLPAVSLPAGRAENGLPLGFQCVARWREDERLIAWAREIEPLLRTV